jgi:predicted DNA-binding protein
MTIALQVPPKLEARLRDEAAREGVDEGTLVLRAIEQQFDSATDMSLAAREAKLALQINEGPSEAVWRRYHELSAKRDPETLTPEEHEALIGLSETIEAADMKRLEQMVELAKLRGVDLRTIRTQLGIPPSHFSSGRDDA